MVYRLNKYKTQNSPKYPVVNALFGAIRVDKKERQTPKMYYHGKGIGICSSGSFSMGAQGIARNVIIFGVDNKHSLIQ